jgi:RNA polymerase sigma factor (sigma-70 family)
VQHVESSQVNDPTLESYYRKYGPAVYRRCLWLLRDQERALDASQDVFVALMTRESEHPIRNVSSYLFRVATNICLKIIEKDRKKQEIGDESLLQMLAGMEQVEEYIASKELLEQAFADLPPSTQELAVMVYIDNMTYEEVSQIIGLSISGIKKRLNALSKRLHLLEGGQV